MIPVIVESPYGSPDPAVRERNKAYLCAAMRDCILRGESPYASHGLYTQPGVLVDEIPEERKLGIAAGFVWRPLAKKTVVYQDLGISTGMEYGIKHARSIGHEIEMRSIPDFVAPGNEGADVNLRRLLGTWLHWADVYQQQLQSVNLTSGERPMPLIENTRHALGLTSLICECHHALVRHRDGKCTPSSSNEPPCKCTGFVPRAFPPGDDRRRCPKCFRVSFHFERCQHLDCGHSPTEIVNQES